MKKNTVTEREIYTSILEGTFDVEVLKEFATRKLAQLDHRNEKAKERAAAKRAEGDTLMEAVFSCLTDEPQSRQDVFDALVATGEYEDLKLGQVGFRLTALCAGDEPRAVKQEAKITDENGKSHSLMVYTRA